MIISSNQISNTKAGYEFVLLTDNHRYMSMVDRFLRVKKSLYLFRKSSTIINTTNGGSCIRRNSPLIRAEFYCNLKIHEKDARNKKMAVLNVRVQKWSSAETECVAAL